MDGGPVQGEESSPGLTNAVRTVSGDIQFNPGTPDLRLDSIRPCLWHAQSTPASDAGGEGGYQGDVPPGSGDPLAAGLQHGGEPASS